MSVLPAPSRPLGRFPRARAARRLVIAVSASLLALAFAAPALSVPTVELGTADPYSVLTTSLTSNGASAMSENMGSVGPLAGDTPPIVLGQTHIGGALVTAARADMDLAYGDAVLRPAVPLPFADFAGGSLPPGVYNATTAMGFTAGGTLTLDGGGNPDAVFIFQIGGALSVGASAQVALINGAQPCNVFWAVNGATTIGATSKFAGTVMTSVGVTVGPEAASNGRLLGRRRHHHGLDRHPDGVHANGGRAGTRRSGGSRRRPGHPGHDGRCRSRRCPRPVLTAPPVPTAPPAPPG